MGKYRVELKKSVQKDFDSIPKKNLFYTRSRMTS